ncbi:hypothetical protein DV451_003097 [Geotrichum candidum]|uniref:Major facilitator superfamily (MFS) profile domain-containing protein n=1 Tax=Geotrichum candidum TaxID=1173061 RepID=A0A9P5KS44_GEOCN|nr:hypothetical protein DV451_003097 [Geotrichum candidum]KAF5106736.1 hypothetical protein DV453_003696 [Geotrichum candidum]
MAAGGNTSGPLVSKRDVLVKSQGMKAILENSRVFLIAVFASLGGLVYGYNQGMFGQILSMHSFGETIAYESISNTTTRGLLTAILELGAWVGSLANGYVADKLGRKLSVDIAVVIFCAGVIVQACAKNKDYILGGRFVTGIGVGALSMLVPLYNAELAPPEIRGGMVVLQQLSITFGIMVSYWIGYGTNYIGGTGEGQSDAAWLIPICIQIAPAVLLAVGMLFMPQSPRWLMNQGRNEECLNTIAKLRGLPADSEIVSLEYLEIKAQYLFDEETKAELYPDCLDGSTKSNFKLFFKSYATLFKGATFKRTIVAIMIMTFQQWSGINGVLYYAPFIFKDLGLSGTTTSLLASGVVGIVMFVATIPAVIFIDKLGRRPLLIAGAIGMAISHFVVAGIIGGYEGEIDQHKVAAWVAVVFIWIFVVHFGYSWGGGAWVLISEVFPLGLRAKGVAIGASFNWLNNFAVAMATPDMIATMKYGAYIFFGIICILGAAYVTFLVPETKGVSLEEMDEIFKDESGQGQRDLERMQRIWGELGLLGDSIPNAVEKEAINKISEDAHVEKA